MDLIVSTWNTTTQSPLAAALFVACAVIVPMGIIIALVVYDKKKRTTKLTALSIWLGTAAALAITLPIALTQPLVEYPAGASYLQASGTIDTITPDLNRGGTGIRLTERPEILLVISEDESDTFAGLQGHDTTLYCTTPRDLDQDNPALAAGTILDCGPTPKPSSNNPVYAALMDTDIPDDAHTTTTAITIVDEPNQ